MSCVFYSSYCTCFSQPLRVFGNEPDIIVGSNEDGGDEAKGHIL